MFFTVADWNAVRCVKWKHVVKLFNHSDKLFNHLVELFKSLGQAFGFRLRLQKLSGQVEQLGRML